MATDPSFVDHLQSQSGLGDALTSKKMFGEYALYLEGRVVALVCDNQLYLKPTDEGRSLLRKVSEHPPYPGAKPWLRIDDETEDRELLGRLFHTTARALPLPKQKKKPKARPKPVGTKPSAKAKVRTSAKAR